MMLTYLSKQMKVNLINTGRINSKSLHRIWAEFKEVSNTHIYTYIHIYMYTLYYKYILGIYTQKYRTI